VQASQTYEQSAQLFWNSGRRGRALYSLVGPDAAGPDLFKPIVGRGSAYLDMDGDGDLDVVITANGGPPLVLRNDGGNASKSIRLKLIGSKSNRDGIGARIRVTVAGKTYERQHFLAKGYLSSVEEPITIGLGAAESADIEVVWPSGAKSSVEGAKPGSVKVEEPKAP
jgi:hypothetical protein